MSNLDHAGKAKIVVVVAAAGRSRRFGMDKLAKLLGEVTVLERASAALREALPDAPLIVVVAADRVGHWRGVLQPQFSGLEVIPGGPRRQDSVRLGVERAKTLGAEIVVVHDGARPLIHRNDVTRVTDSLGRGVAVILCAEVSDTLKRIGTGDVITETVDRDRLRSAQTPQVFRVEALETAWRRQDLSCDWSDEAAILEADGCEVHTVLAEYPNPKLTTARDLEMVRLMEEVGP